MQRDGLMHKQMILCLSARSSRKRGLTLWRKGIEESETMVYFVDGSSFRKKGFGSRKPAMAVPDLLKKVGGE
nr:hypothetical protein Iba_chr02aCG12860 [Ipomoea batatas]